MPQGKHGQGSAGRSGKDASRTVAKNAPANQAKGRVAAAAAKPAVRRRVESVVKPKAKSKVTKAVAKPAEKRRAAETAINPAMKRKAAKAVAKTVKTRLKVERATQMSTAVEQQAAVEPAIESSVVPWSIAPEFESAIQRWNADAPIEPVMDVLVAAPVDDGWGTNGEIDPDVLSYHAVESVAAHIAAVAAAESAADSLFKPFIERRVSFRSLLERRLMDPSAKERRISDSLAKEVEAAAIAKAPEIAAAGKERRARIAAEAKETREANPAAAPFVERRVADRRADHSVDAELRVREQQTRFNETALWMRKGGAALIGLNVLIMIAVLFLWRSHSSQTPDVSEMQKATMAEMRRATTASEVAAYASCLGSQTARSMMLQMKAGGTAPRVSPSVNGLQTIAATRAQAAQIEFDVEKTTSVNVHVPVLFHLGIENIGKSSALNTKVWGAVKVLDSGKEPDFKYSEVALSKAAISPSDPAAKVILYSADDAGLVVPMNDTTMQRVNSGQAYVVAYGKVVYEDIFGVRHWAVFCHNVTEPAGASMHNKCMAYNSTGVSEIADRSVEMPAGPQSAAVSLPEIACVRPKDEKN